MCFCLELDHNQTLRQWVMIMLWLASPLEEGKYIGVEAKECGRETPIIHVNMPHLLGEMARIRVN